MRVVFITCCVFKSFNFLQYFTLNIKFLYLHQCTACDLIVVHDQLVEAARNGRADDVIALLAEGANIECKDWVRD